MALFSYGFRPFFLGACASAIVSVVPWIAVVAGHWTFSTRYGLLVWHTHEALFGYGGAAVAGFLLTAIPNWTGRLPLTGRPLAALFALWCCGRVGFLALDVVGLYAVAAIDSAFLPALVVLAACDVVAARNWRNLKTVALLALFAAADIGFYAEILAGSNPDRATRLGIAALVGLIILIGGRMAPNFTHQWLLIRKAERLPSPFGRLDVIALAATGTSLLFWIVAPQDDATAFVVLLAGGLQIWRIARWRGLSTWRDPLILILHVGYGFVPLGFMLIAISAVAPLAISPAAALHAWTTGAIGATTLGVMTRAARGHTGRALIASRATGASYVAVVIAALLRIAAGILPGAAAQLTAAAGIAWAAAFALFLVEYATMLVRDRAS